MLGGETLFELRTALQLADLERTGGIGAHVSPMVGQSPSPALQPIRASPRRSSRATRPADSCHNACAPPRTLADPKDVSSLLQRAGFTMLTVDVEEIVMGYPSVWELMQDLKDMGESNSIFGRCVRARARPVLSALKLRRR